jgi:hypothetical protein
VNGKAYFLFQSRTGGIQSIGPFGAQEKPRVPIAPVIGMGGEKTGGDPQPFDRIELIVTHRLAMHEDVPVIFAGVFALGLVDGIDDIVDGSIPVAVNGDLHPGAMKFFDQLHHELLFRNGIAAVVAVSLKRRLVGLTQIGGICLDGPIADDFSRSDLEKSRVVSGNFKFFLDDFFRQLDRRPDDDSQWNPPGLSARANPLNIFSSVYPDWTVVTP